MFRVRVGAEVQGEFWCSFLIVAPESSTAPMAPDHEYRQAYMQQGRVCQHTRPEAFPCKETVSG